MAGRSIISTVCYPSTERSKYSNCTVNPGQTRIFYKAGQTRMTRRKCDPDDPTRFQPCHRRFFKLAPLELESMPSYFKSKPIVLQMGMHDTVF